MLIVQHAESTCADEYITKTCTNWELVKQFMIDFVRYVRAGDNSSQVALISYGREAKVEFYLNE